MPFALDGEGRPIFLISTMAMHTQNLQQDAPRQPAVHAAWKPKAIRWGCAGDGDGQRVGPRPRTTRKKRDGFTWNVSPTVSTGWTSTIFPSSAWT